MTRLATSALACALAVGCAEPAVVRVERGETLVLEVEVDIARTAAERMRGLMGRAELGPGEGLLIENPDAIETCIANSGVDFSIDAIFVDDRRAVTAIERAIAANDALFRCHDSTRWVLEVSGTVALSVQPGDAVSIAE